MPNQGELTYVTRIDRQTGKPLPSKGRRKVFISYKKKDNRVNNVRDIVVRRILELVDCAVWFDETLTPGEDFNEEIRQAITESDALVLLLTRNIHEEPSYVWTYEVPVAQEQHKGIIPIAFDLDEKGFALAAKKLGEGTQIYQWPSDKQDDISTNEYAQFNDGLKNALDRFVISADLTLRVERFFASGNDALPLTRLTPEDQYLKGYGHINGVGTGLNAEKGAQILDPLAHLSGSDEDTTRLRAEAANTLVKHYAFPLKKGSDYEACSQLAVEYAKIGMDAGSEESVQLISELGRRYMASTVIARNTAKGEELLLAASDHGHVDSTYMLGVFYDKAANDLSKAAQMYQRASDMGSNNAMYRLGQMYRDGTGVARDHAKAARLFTAASDLGNTNAKNDLGVLYIQGRGVEPDLARAAELYAQAADLGSTTAMGNLGGMYLRGTGVEQDVKRAFTLFQAARGKGDTKAMLHLGNMYYTGNGVDFDFRLAQMFYTEASDGRDPDGHIWLADRCVEGKFIPADYARAHELYQRAADAGHPGGLTGLARLYEKGMGVKKSKRQARKYYAQAVEKHLQLAANGDSFSLYVLGCMYRAGQGVKKSYAKAHEYFEQALAAENASAGYYLGAMYLNGDGVKKNSDKAVEYFSRASELGDSDATGYLAELYFYGRKGVAKDRLKAYELFTLAAEQGSAAAMFMLSSMLYTGQTFVPGLEKDTDRADALMLEAARRGHPKAIKMSRFMGL